MKNEEEVKGLRIYQESKLKRLTDQINIIESRAGIPKNTSIIYLDELVNLKKEEQRIKQMIDLLTIVLI